MSSTSNGMITSTHWAHYWEGLLFMAHHWPYWLSLDWKPAMQVFNGESALWVSPTSVGFTSYVCPLPLQLHNTLCHIGSGWLYVSTAHFWFLIRSLNTSLLFQVFELLSALCVYNADGYARAVDTLDRYKVRVNLDTVNIAILFITYCFFHTRERISSLHGIPNNSPTNFIFTCPIAWAW